MSYKKTTTMKNMKMKKKLNPNCRKLGGFTSVLLIVESFFVIVLISIVYYVIRLLGRCLLCVVSLFDLEESIYDFTFMDCIYTNLRWQFMETGITKLKRILEGLPEPQFTCEEFCTIELDRSRGFVFITLASVQEAKEAIRMFNGSVSVLPISLHVHNMLTKCLFSTTLYDYLKMLKRRVEALQSNKHVVDKENKISQDVREITSTPSKGKLLVIPNIYKKNVCRIV
ncbi:hypothetical protein L6452_17148 [Arctium lappa]|uniref:Uncharacterized protein n=1 Tax=Arctium lappa TaxID=4217 RepID=A0ACB9C2H2_ARCLA|nr:hypothetical protein L6452_17148 [Arctium lappa]